MVGGGTPPSPEPGPLDGMACPFAPDAVVVATASPVELVIIAEGTYELTLVTYDHDGTPIEEVTMGSTWPGLVEQFAVTAPAAAPPVTPPTSPAQPGTSPAPQRRGGGSAFPLWMLFVLGGLAVVRRPRQR